MPIHDWTTVAAAIFHDFHATWIQSIKKLLNDRVLPPEYYAISEQVAIGVRPDVLTLETAGATPPPPGHDPVGLVTAAPRTRFVTELGPSVRRRKNRVAVRRADDDRVAAVVEIVSPGNTSGRHAVRAFVGKAVDFLTAGVHLLIVDLFPPGRRDPRGLHSLIQEELSGGPFTPPAGKPLTLAAYEADRPPRAYVEPVAVGDALPDMPLFLVAGGHVPVPLEESYRDAWGAVPARWRRVIEGRA